MKTVKFLNYIFVIALGFFAVMFGIDRFSSKTTTLSTVGYCDNIQGYNGTIPMEIVMKDGKIESINILDNNETPGFLKKVTDAQLVEKFYGLTPQEAVDLKVDVVSGATYSSNGIIESVKTRMASCNEEVETSSSTWTWQLFGIIGCAVILLVLSFCRKKCN